MILYHLIEFARSVVGRFPVVISYSVADAVGDIIYWSWPRGRRNMSKSVASLMNADISAPEVRNTARHCMRNYCKYIVDILRYSNPGDAFFRENFEVDGLENLDNALREGKGVILISFHLGNLDLGARFLSSVGYPVNAIINNLSSGQVNKFIQGPRSHEGVNLITSEESPARLLDILRRNEILALMIDCPYRRRGVDVKLGRESVSIPSGTAVLSLRTGARIIPCALVHSSSTTFRGVIGKPIEYEPTGKIVDDVRELTQRSVSVLEDMTRSSIDQWYIFHPFIKDNTQITEDSSPEDAVFNPNG